MTLKSDLSRVRRACFDHQVYGVEWLVDRVRPEEGRIIPDSLLLADEMGAGKTKQVIDAAQVLFELGEIKNVIVVAPAPVRAVWVDRDMGELQKHMWLDLPGVVNEYHARTRRWLWPTNEFPNVKRLTWTVTNYEFLRDAKRLAALLPEATDKTLLVLDESTWIKNHRSQQFKACFKLRQRCARVWLLNGTPIAHTPADMFAQSLMMDGRILGCRQWIHFRAQYCVMGGWMQKQVVGWRNLEDMQQKLKPYVLRRLKADCMDLPPKLEPVT